MAIFKVLYHKPSKEIVHIKRGWQYSDAEQTGDFLLAEIDTASYDPVERKITVTIGAQSKDIPIAVLAKKLDIGERFSFEESETLQAAIDSEECDWLHNKLVGMQ